MLRRSVELFVGSVVVYVVVSACAGSGALDGPELSDNEPAPQVTVTGDGGATVSPGQSGGRSGGPSSGGESSTGEGGTQGEGGSILSPVPDATAAEDGERIVNRFRVTADGLKRSEGYHDTLRDEACSFQPTESGGERCMPSGAPIFAGYFADSECADPVALVTDGTGCAPVYITEFGKTDDGTCSGRAFARIYQTGAQALEIWSNASGECVATTALDAWASFRRGNRIPDSEFAAGSIQIGDQ